MKRYAGNPDPRFVAIHRGGDLDLATHRLLVGWATASAEHVLHLFTEVNSGDARPSHAIAIAREWAILAMPPLHTRGKPRLGLMLQRGNRRIQLQRKSDDQRGMPWQPLTWRTMSLGLPPLRFEQ